MGYPDHPTLDLPSPSTPLADLVAAVSLDPAGVRNELLQGLTGGQCRPGHLCATAWTLDHERTNALLVRHPRFGWMPPGGHLHARERPADGALRELYEESGVEGRYVNAVSVHGTMIPARANEPEHMHYAIGIGIVADKTLPLRPEQDHDAAWFSLDDLPDSFFGDNHLLRTIRHLVT